MVTIGGSMRVDRIQSPMRRSQPRGHSNRASPYAAGTPIANAARVDIEASSTEFRKYTANDPPPNAAA